MKKWFVSLLAFCCVLMANGQVSVQQQYIDKFAGIAVEEMLRSGVPASITLAQGLLESGAGQSRLAVEGNNHFGIKCHKGWEGRSLRHDDDARAECFRAYDSPEESFRDHSDFLRYRDRYKFLFDLDRTDYKAWAYGLKEAGYATDPKYPQKLIKNIEEYGLARYDIVSQQQEAEIPEAPNKIEMPVALPDSPAAAAAAEGVSADGKKALPQEDFRFSLSRRSYSLNGVPFIYAMEGESYASIARHYNLFPKEILRYNDLQADEPIAPGTIVYLAAKKNKAQKGLDYYIVEDDGEDFHAICQRFAVKEKAIRKLNNLGSGTVTLRQDDKLKLR